MVPPVRRIRRSLSIRCSVQQSSGDIRYPVPCRANLPTVLFNEGGALRIRAFVCEDWNSLLAELRGCQRNPRGYLHILLELNNCRCRRKMLAREKNPSRKCLT